MLHARNFRVNGVVFSDMHDFILAFAQWGNALNSTIPYNISSVVLNNIIGWDEQILKIFNCQMSFEKVILSFTVTGLHSTCWDSELHVPGWDYPNSILNILAQKCVSYSADKPNLLEFYVKMTEMTLKVMDIYVHACITCNLLPQFVILNVRFSIIHI